MNTKNNESALELTTVSSENVKRYGILADISRQSIVVIRFCHHSELINLILSDSNQHLVLYRTQYELPTTEDLETLSTNLFG